METFIKTFLQWTLIAWFIIFSMIVFLPALKLLLSKETSTVSQLDSIPKPPEAPKTFAITTPDSIKNPEAQKVYIATLEMKVKAFEQEVAVYEANVKSYSLQIEAVKAYNGTFTKSSLKDIYTTIVNDKLLGVLTSLITAFVAYVFVKGGTNMYFNKKATEISKDLEHFSLF